MGDEGKTEEAEATMMRIAEVELGELSQQAMELWPERFAILRSAFDAHEKGHYYVLGPLEVLYCSAYTPTSFLGVFVPWCFVPPAHYEADYKVEHWSLDGDDHDFSRRASTSRRN